MELGKYQDIAQDIVMRAVKELAIERGVKELAEVWKSMEFNVVKHYKGIQKSLIFNRQTNMRVDKTWI